MSSNRPVPPPTFMPEGAPGRRPSARGAAEPAARPVPRAVPAADPVGFDGAMGGSFDEALGAGRPRRSVEGRPKPAATRAASDADAPRRVRLSLSRVDPWSVMKLSFLASVAVAIILVVATAIIWTVLNGLGVFTSIDDTVSEITDGSIRVLNYVGFGRVLSLATLVSVIDIVLLTALSTLGAFLYNITAALVGGVNLTLAED